MSHLPSRHRREINLSILTPSVISLDGSEDGVAEAAGYENKLRALSKRILPRDNNVGGFPMIDLALIGVGDDGHIGSLYPNRDEINFTTGPWVISSYKKNPPDISLSLPVMQHAKQTVIAAAGQSVKYPNGKSFASNAATAIMARSSVGQKATIGTRTPILATTR